MADLTELRARALAWAAACGLSPRRRWWVAVAAAEVAAQALAGAGDARVDFAVAGDRLEVRVAGAPADVAHDLADDVDPREGGVILAWALPAPCPAPADPPPVTLDALRAEDRALLDLLQARDGEVSALHAEIEATSHGLLAVHAELEATRQAEARLAAIVQSSVDAMCVITPDQIVTTWNAGAAMLLGYSPEEAIGRPATDFLPEPTRAALAAGMRSVRAGARSSRFDSHCLRKDGTLVEVNITLSAIHGQDADLSGYAVVVHDLTERRRIQGELAAARAREEVSAERERIAQDLHDLVIQRLYASGMFLQLALKVQERTELDARIERVIDDLDATVAEIRSTIFALGQPVAGLRRQVLQLAADAARVMGFRPRVHFDGPVDTVVAPEVAEHVLAVAREALSNIARHAQASEADVTLRAGDEVVLEVSDDGRGIGDTTRSSGLANMRRRAVALGGTLDVQSEPGRGTRLRWRVPTRSA